MCSYKSIYILYHLILYYITLYTYTFAWVYMGQYIYTYTLIYFYVYIHIIYVRTYICIYTHTRKCVYRHSNLLCVSLGGSTFRDYATFACLVVQQPCPCQAYVQGIMLNRTLAADQRMQFQSHPFDEPHHVLS